MGIGPAVLAIPIYFLLLGIQLIFEQVTSGIFEKRAWLFVSEILRMFALPILVHHYIGPKQNTLVVLTIAGSISVFSIVSLLTFKNLFNRPLAYGK